MNWQISSMAEVNEGVFASTFLFSYVAEIALLHTASFLVTHEPVAVCSYSCLILEFLFTAVLASTHHIRHEAFLQVVVINVQSLVFRIIALPQPY